MSSSSSIPGHDPSDQKECSADQEQDLLGPDLAAAKAEKKTDREDDQSHELKESSEESAHLLHRRNGQQIVFQEAGRLLDDPSELFVPPVIDKGGHFLQMVAFDRRFRLRLRTIDGDE